MVGPNLIEVKFEDFTDGNKIQFEHCEYQYIGKFHPSSNRGSKLKHVWQSHFGEKRIFFLISVVEGF